MLPFGGRDSNIVLESNYAERRKNDSPRGKENPSGYKNKCLIEMHGSIPTSGAQGRASPLDPPHFVLLLLLRTRWRFAVHVLLHARIAFSQEVFHLGLLVRREQLEHFVVNARLLHL